MHNKISAWFIFINNIDYILKNIDIMKGITDDIHIYVRRKIKDKNILDILSKYNVKIDYKNNHGIKYIFKESKYDWSIIVEKNLFLTKEDIKFIYDNIEFSNECINKDKYFLLKNNIK